MPTYSGRNIGVGPDLTPFLSAIALGQERARTAEQQTFQNRMEQERLKAQQEAQKQEMEFKQHVQAEQTRRQREEMEERVRQLRKQERQEEADAKILKPFGVRTWKEFEGQQAVKKAQAEQERQSRLEAQAKKFGYAGAVEMEMAQAERTSRGHEEQTQSIIEDRQRRAAEAKAAETERQAQIQRIEEYAKILPPAEQQQFAILARENPAAAFAQAEKARQQGREEAERTKLTEEYAKALEGLGQRGKVAAQIARAGGQVPAQIVSDAFTEAFPDEEKKAKAQAELQWNFYKEIERGATFTATQKLTMKLIPESVWEREVERLIQTDLVMYGLPSKREIYDQYSGRTKPTAQAGQPRLDRITLPNGREVAVSARERASMQVAIQQGMPPEQTVQELGDFVVRSAGLVPYDMKKLAAFVPMVQGMAEMTRQKPELGTSLVLHPIAANLVDNVIAAWEAAGQKRNATFEDTLRETIERFNDTRARIRGGNTETPQRIAAEDDPRTRLGMRKDIYTNLKSAFLQGGVPESQAETIAQQTAVNTVGFVSQFLNWTQAYARNPKRGALGKTADIGAAFLEGAETGATGISFGAKPRTTGESIGRGAGQMAGFVGALWATGGILRALGATPYAARLIALAGRGGKAALDAKKVKQIADAVKAAEAVAAETMPTFAKVAKPIAGLATKTARKLGEKMPALAERALKTGMDTGALMAGQAAISEDVTWRDALEMTGKQMIYGMTIPGAKPGQGSLSRMFEGGWKAAGAQGVIEGAQGVGQALGVSPPVTAYERGLDFGIAALSGVLWALLPGQKPIGLPPPREVKLLGPGKPPAPSAPSAPSAAPKQRWTFPYGQEGTPILTETMMRVRPITPATPSVLTEARIEQLVRMGRIPEKEQAAAMGRFLKTVKDDEAKEVLRIFVTLRQKPQLEIAITQGTPAEAKAVAKALKTGNIPTSAPTPAPALQELKPGMTGIYNMNPVPRGRPMPLPVELRRYDAAKKAWIVIDKSSSREMIMHDPERFVPEATPAKGMESKPLHWSQKLPEEMTLAELDEAIKGSQKSIQYWTEIAKRFPTDNSTRPNLWEAENRLEAYERAKATKTEATPGKKDGSAATAQAEPTFHPPETITPERPMSLEERRAEAVRKAVGAPAQPKAGAQAAKAKEPWEMTRSEVLSDMWNLYGAEDSKAAISEHYQDVAEALRQGKLIPAKVLKDYPDLAKKYRKP